MNIYFKMNYLVISAAGALLLSSCVTEPTAIPTPEPQQPPQTVIKDEPKPEYIQIALRDAGLIGQKIWMNEGSAKVDNLVVWNKGEGFASLGIGHFIWYPPGKDGPYTETFPQLVAFLQQKGLQVPAWLPETSDAPWSSYEAFQFNRKNSQWTELRDLLTNTIPYQVQFIIQRLDKALPQMLQALPTQGQRDHVFQQFYRVVAAPNGIYALVDYVNFKGEGINLNEHYRGQGWGLLQVFESMQGDTPKVMADFAQAADLVLRRRIQNSPPERNESRWYPGWKNRINTYDY